MSATRMRPRPDNGLWTTVAFALLYVALALVGRSTLVEGTTFALVWPAGGVAVLWFLVRGVGPVSVDSLLLGVLVLAVNWLTHAPLGISLVLVATNLLQTLVAVALLRRWLPEVWGCGGSRPLDSPRLLGPYVVAAVVATGSAALVGSLAFSAIQGHLHAMGGLLWFGRNLCSVLTLTTFGILLGQRLATGRPRPPFVLPGGAARLELTLAATFTLVTYGLAFVFDDLPLLFPILAGTAWIGLRVATLLSAAYATVIGAATVVLTLSGVGPFARVEDLELGALLAQMYVMTIVVTALALSTGRDERESLLAELRRTQAEALYEASLRDAIISSMTEGLVVVDAAEEFLVTNQAAADVLGDARRWVTHPDGTPLLEHERPIVRALRGESVRDMELMLGRPGEPVRILAVSAVPLPYDLVRGTPRALVLYRDITSEHAHREELSAFAGVVAHDLRNPLAAIDGWTELIADELDGGELPPELAQEFVTRVRSASGRMRELISDLLDHATSSARGLNLSRVDMTALAAEVVAGRNAEAQVGHGRIPVVRGDPVLIRQVLDNLVGNALKYVAPGEQARVEVSGHRSADGHWVRIRVTDHGIGLPAGEHERVFEEFHRVHHREYDGSGLGLSICRRIISRHGGTIAAFDNPAGRGTIFEFTLPAAEPVEQPSAPRDESSVARSA